MYCMNCGKEITAEARFCGYCGCEQELDFEQLAKEHEEKKEEAGYEKIPTCIVLSQVDTAGEFSEGMAPVRDSETELWGYIDRWGEYVLPPVYKRACEFREGLALVQEIDSGRYGFIDKSGAFAIPAIFEVAGSFCEGLAKIYDGDSGLWGYINNKGEWIVEPQFAIAGDFREGLVCVADENHLWGYIERNSVMIPKATPK